MLGLARSQYENAVFADYTQSVETAFTTAMIQMISKTGRLAWCPEFCQARDSVVILASEKVPFVFRRLATS